jgi:hypothetical protein
MPKTEPGRLRPSFSLTAGALTQLLASFACFLGAAVLPYTFPELQGQSQTLLVILGCIMLVLGILNVIFGRQLGRLLSRAGKRSRVVVPREGIAYLGIMLVLAVGALLGHRNMPLLLFGMMAGPFVMNGWIVYAMLKGVSLKRHAPRRAVAGEFFGVEIEVSNGKRIMTSHMLEVRDRINGDALGKSHRDEEGSVTFVRLPAGEQRVGRYQLRFSKRGLYSLGPMRVSSRFPLGIGERGQLFPDVTELLVHPPIGRLLPTWTRRQKELTESNRRVKGRQGLFDDEFDCIREFRSDDNPRSIHWRSTARRGQLMVREFQQHRQADSLVILDLPELADWSTEASEMAISLAATVCIEQTRSSSGNHNLLAIVTRDVQLICSRTPSGFREETMDALAVCNRSAKADLVAAFSKVVAEHNLHDERIILITPRPAAAALAMQQVTQALHTDSVNLAAQTTIVEATCDTMEEVFQLADTSSRRQTHSSAAASQEVTS